MFQSFDEFLAASRMQIPVLGFITNLILTAVLALILSSIYVRYGNSLSNRRLFSRNFLMITMTTMLIISIVKSSLALSLGLVGALSVIRFRTAIKEPEELAYLFLAISIGLGFGANQGVITVVAFAIITVIIILVGKFSDKTYENQNLNLTVISYNPSKIGADKIVDTLRSYCTAVNLRRLDETKDIVEASFLVEFRNFEQLNKAKIVLQEIDDSLKFSFLDSQRMY